MRALRHPALGLALAFAIMPRLAAQDVRVLKTAEEVRRLTAEEAGRHLPVHLRGVVTFFDESLFSRFVQDATAGIYLRQLQDSPPLLPGQVVEIEGVTSPGEYAPIIIPTRQQVVGDADLPVAKEASFEQLASGQEDSQFVEVRGIVRSTYLEDGHRLIEVATGGGRLTAYVTDSPATETRDLADSTVRIRGVCSTQFNRQRQLFAIRLLVARPGDFVVEKAAPTDPFAIPAQSIGSLLQFTPQGTYGHRVKVAGTVTYHQPGSTLFIQDDKQGLFVQTQQRTPLQVGDRVEVLGFPDKGRYTPLLQDAVYQKLSSGPAPQAVAITLDEALKGTYDCMLVQIEATLLDRARQSREGFLVLQSGDFVFDAHQEKERGHEMSKLQNGSKVSVTGVCLIELGSDWRAGDAWRAKSFRLLLRSPADVVLLKAPSWWTLRKLLWIVGILGFGVMGAFAWVWVLRRRVQKQTQIIRQKLQAEAALKERYVDLFENANDMVYTHDLDGRMTSINQAGERLLQRSRDQILSGNILDLILPEQQAAARTWLGEVRKKAAPPTVEWDFAANPGQPMKLEISARLIEQADREIEIEGIARDITERKRLERELLEISNREQRRIGHDLHDGVCQQLVGIGYLTETLAERLQEKGSTEAGDAERIGYLLNHAILQTRGVARGLFPVRLEENGLVSALEELAGNASQLFQIKCAFAAENAPERVDNAVALHLFYIVQEAVANAVKHGKAKNVRISLEKKNQRYALKIKDDGVGFPLNNNNHPGMGLRIMNYRARVIGATFQLKSDPGAGTQITCAFVPTFSEGPLNSTPNHASPVS